jgi:hypothetical protein
MFSNSGGGKKNKKPADKELEDDDQEDQGRNPKFQDASKIIKVIFGGDEDFGSCPSSRRYHNHSVGQRSPSPSPVMISG